MKRTENFFCFSITPKDFLSSEDFLLLSFEAKGFLFHALLSCWANGSLPAAPPDLGRLLGAPPEQIAELLPTLTRYFATDNKGRLTCPILDAERRRVREVSLSHQKLADKRWDEKRRKDAEADEKAREQQKRNQDDTCVRNAVADANAMPSDSYSGSDSGSERELSPPPTTTSPPPAPTPEVAADDSSRVLEYLTASGKEFGLTPWEAKKLIDENGNGSGLTKGDWGKIVNEMRDQAQTMKIRNAYAFMKVLVEDRRNEKAFNAEHPAPPARETSPLTLPDEDTAQRLTWTLEPGGDRDGGLRMLEAFAPSWGEAERVSFADLFAEMVVQGGPGYREGKSNVTVLQSVARKMEMSPQIT